MQNSTLAAGKATGRADQLQFLRFLAFWNVFINHAESWNFFGYPAAYSGGFVVSFFIVLSGLVTGYGGYYKRIAPTPKNIAKDMWKRIVKIYPLYFLTMIIPLLYSSFPEWISTGNWEELGPQLLQLGKNLLMIQAWFPKGMFTFNIVGWFMSMLLFLNLFNFPVLHLLHKVEEKPKKYWLYIFGIAFLSFLAFFYCGLTRRLPLRFWQGNFPPARLCEYIVGIILGYGIRSFSKTGFPEKISSPVYTLAEIGALGIWWAYLHWRGPYWTYESVHWLLPNLILLFVFTFGGGLVSKAFRWKPLVFLGDISFECYLIHELVVMQYEIYHGWTIVSDLDKAVAICYCMLITVLAASLFHKTKAKK